MKSAIRSSTPSDSPLGDLHPDRVLSRALVRTAGLLELSQAELARILGVSDSSVSRLVGEARQVDAGSKEGELALLLVRVYRSLDALVGGDAQARHAWLRSHNAALNGTPAALLQSAAGLVNTVAYLDSARARL